MNSSADPRLLRSLVMAGMDCIQPLPRVMVQTLIMLDDEDAHTQNLAEVLEQDATLSGRMLGLANRAGNRLSEQREITDVRTTISVLGFTRIHMLVSSLGARDSLTANLKSPLRETFWDHCLNVGSATKVIAEHAGLSPELAYVAGLLHDIGYLWLVLNMPDEAARHDLLLQDPTYSVVGAEREAYGIDHGEVGEILGQLWGLPESITTAVRGHHDPDAMTPNPYVMAVHLAEMICQGLSLDQRPRNCVSTLSERAFEVLSLEDVDLHDLLGEISARSRYIRTLMGYHIA